MKVFGIDPGLDGGIAILEDGQLRLTIDMPTNAVVENKKNKRVTDFRAVSDFFLEHITDEDHHIYVEKLWAQNPHRFNENVPATAGIVSTWRQAEDYGGLKGVIQTLRLKHTFVAPVTWKKLVMKGVNGTGKDASVIRCMQLFPNATLLRNSRCSKPSDGRAEAILIAYYGCINLVETRLHNNE